MKSLNEKVRQHYEAYTFLKKRLPLCVEVYYDRFANQNWHGLSLAQSIFIKQILAIALHTRTEKKLSLGRVLALILLNEISSTAVYRPIIQSLSEDSPWMRERVQELSSDTDEIRFVRNCKQMLVEWAEPGPKPTFASAIPYTLPRYDFLYDATRLVEIPRAGWVNWHVAEEFIDTVADHTIVAELLAISMNQIYDYGFDPEIFLPKVAIHDLSAARIGDLPLFVKSPAERLDEKTKAFYDLVCTLPEEEKLRLMFSGYQSHETCTDIFADHCGRLETDFWAKVCSERGAVDLDNQKDNPAMKDRIILGLFEDDCSFGEIWMKYSQISNGYDEHFLDVSRYVLANGIFPKK